MFPQIEIGQLVPIVIGQLVSGRTTAEPLQVNDGGGTMTVLIYLVLLGLIAGAVILLLRKNKIGGIKGGSNRLSILESRMLGGRQFLVVGEYDGKTFLLGVCPGRIDYLCSLEEKSSGRDNSFGAVLQNEEKKS